MRKTLLVSAGVAIVLVCVLFGALFLAPSPILGRAVISVGFPLGELLMRLLPSAVVYELVPEGGGAAAALVIVVSTLLTWFLIFWGCCFVLFSRMRSNSALHADAPTAARP